MAVNAVVFLLCLAVRYISGASTPFYGVIVGHLSTLQYEVSGDVYIVDEKRIRIKHFVYNGRGPAAYFWGGQRGESGQTPDQTGILIPDENGRSEKLGRYNDADIVLTLPSPLTTRNMVWLSVWCEAFSVDFGNVLFPANVRVPRPTVIGQFSDEANGVSSGNVTVRDVNNVNVKAFTCSCSQSDVQFVGDMFQAIAEKLVTFQQSGGRSANLDTAAGLRLNLTVPAPRTVMEFDFIGVHSFDDGVTLARIPLPSPLLVPPNLRAGTKYHGVSLGRLPTLAHRVTGDVYIIDSKHFLIKNFVYDGTAPQAFFWVGKRGEASPQPDADTGIAVPDRTEASRLTRSYSGEDVTVTLPQSLDVDDILWLSVWCIQYTQNFGHVTLPENVQVPRPVNIGRLSDSVYGVSSGDITVVDSGTVVVDSFTCNCQHTGIKFVGGKDMDMTSNTVRLQHTPSRNLDSADQLDVDLMIPMPYNVHNFQLLKVDSSRHNRTLAYINISSTLLVPPYFGRDETDMPTTTSIAGVCHDHNAVTTLLASAVALIGLYWWWISATGH